MIEAIIHVHNRVQYLERVVYVAFNSAEFIGVAFTFVSTQKTCS